MSEHVAECRNCKRELAALRSISDASAAVSQLEPPSDLRSRIAAATYDRVEKSLAPLFFNWLRDLVSVRGLQTASTAVAALAVIAFSSQAVHEPLSPYISAPTKKAAIEAQAIVPTFVQETGNEKLSSNVDDDSTMQPSIERHRHVVKHRRAQMVASVAAPKPGASLRNAVKSKSVGTGTIKTIDQTDADSDKADEDVDTATVASTNSENDTKPKVETTEKPKSLEVASAPAVTRDDPKEWIKEAKAQAALRRNERSGGLQVFSTRF